VKFFRFLLKFGLALCLISVASCGTPQLTVSGSVTVDGQPLEEGTIHFQPADSEAKGTGSMVQEGIFSLSRQPLHPGKYRVSVAGFRKTGRMVADPQRGQVAETAPWSFQNSPLQIDVSEENCHELKIELKTST
jgi:hypothetical protein